MSEGDSYYERSPRQESTISEYYADLRFSRGDGKAIVIALTKLLDSLPATADVTIEEVFDVKFMEHELNTEPRIATETLALLPLMYIGPILDKSTCHPDILKEWYGDAARGVLTLTDENHTAECHESYERNVDHLACDNSSVCPRRFLERYFTHDAYMPNFYSQPYEDDPLRAMCVARDKVEIAKECQVALPLFCDTTLSEYHEACEDYIAELMRRHRADIDNSMA